MQQPKDSVLRVYDFPPSFREDDLIQSIKDLEFLDFRFSWINDTETLLVFSNCTDAKNIYLKNISNANLKIQVYNQIEEISNEPRPVKTDVVARRMVAGALGLKFKDKDCPKLDKAIKEKQDLQDSQEKKQQDLNTAWDE